MNRKCGSDVRVHVFEGKCPRSRKLHGSRIFIIADTDWLTSNSNHRLLRLQLARFLALVHSRSKFPVTMECSKAGRVQPVPATFVGKAPHHWAPGQPKGDDADGAGFLPISPSNCCYWLLHERTLQQETDEAILGIGWPILPDWILGINTGGRRSRILR